MVLIWITHPKTMTNTARDLKHTPNEYFSSQHDLFHTQSGITRI